LTNDVCWNEIADLFFLFFLQRLPCSFITYALLGSYTAQAELGDYCETEHGLTVDYLRELQFAPEQDDELLKRIHEQHKRHKYMSMREIYLLFCLFDFCFSKRTNTKCCRFKFSRECEEIINVWS